jgi:CheY-like chemotaxis protein
MSGAPTLLTVGHDATSLTTAPCDGSCKAGLAGFDVLVVEDEYYQAQDCCEWLRSAGATVAGPARSGADAKYILDRAKVDAAVVDINLGRGPDFELASRGLDGCNGWKADIPQSGGLVEAHFRLPVMVREYR